MWYVLQVKTGDEIKVRDALLAKGVRALVPQESRMIRKDGKWGRRLYTLIPSYVFVDIKFAAQIYYTIRAIPSVIRFVGTGCGEPSTLTYLEAEWIRLLAGDGEPLESTVIRCRRMAGRRSWAACSPTSRRRSSSTICGISGPR